ncbi:MAG: NAD(P)H-binding protein, partial [Chitinophagales bacterium]|nr:NAD(P)H-binding protein [Chitinophagales bacterium]
MKTAILVGATGLIGNELSRRIPDDAHYEKLIVLVRRKIRLKHLHTQVHEVDFDKPETFAHLIQGNDLFCALGTTMKIAGSKENFRSVDHDLVLQIAEIALKNNINNFVMVSS